MWAETRCQVGQFLDRDWPFACDGEPGSAGHAIRWTGTLGYGTRATTAGVAPIGVAAIRAMMAAQSCDLGGGPKCDR